MTVVPPNLEKGTANVIRARTGSVIGTVAEKRRGTGIRIVKEVTGTESVIATTGTVVSAAREGNTVIVLMIVTVTVTVMIETVTGAMILRGTWLYVQLTVA
jgi:urease gamma subunit